MSYERFDDITVYVPETEGKKFVETGKERREARYFFPQTIAFKKLRPEAIAPKKAFPHDAGWDLSATEEVTVGVGEVAKVKTGIAVAITEGYAGRIAERSGLGSKGIAIRGGEIDAGYRGELIVLMHNLGLTPFHVTPGMRIAQLVIYQVVLDEFEEVDSLPDAVRGDRGFGSSGI